MNGLVSFSLFRVRLVYLFGFFLLCLFFCLARAFDMALRLGFRGSEAFHVSIFLVSCRTISGFSEARSLLSFQSLTRS